MQFVVDKPIEICYEVSRFAELDMRVSIFSDDGARVWEYAYSEDGQSTGFVSPPALGDATTALRIALAQAKGQLGCLDDLDAVPDGRRSAAEVDRNIPVSSTRDSDARWKVREMPSVVAVPPPGLESAEIVIIRKSDVAPMRAIHNDNIPTL